MSLVSVLRRMWSTSASSSSPPRRRRRRPARVNGSEADARWQERTVVAAYRAHVSRSADALAARWKHFDKEPGDHSLYLQIRKERLTLIQAIDAFYAALGRRDTTQVAREVNILETGDARLIAVEQQILAEVQRFVSSAGSINARFSAAASPTERLDVCADANDVLVELELYRNGWVLLMDEGTSQRLTIASHMLRNIVDAAIVSSTSQRNQSPRAGRTEPSRRASKSDPIFVVNRPGHLPTTPARHLTSLTSDSPSIPMLLYPGPDPPPAPTQSESSSKRVFSDVQQTTQIAKGSTNTVPLHMMVSRSRTLRDMAENAMHTNRPDSADIEDATSQSAKEEQPSLAATKSISFASALYKTYNRRVDSISDAGLKLRRSEVRGDGRCLFRSLVRCRCHAKGLPIPSERLEREEADMLRMRTVSELKKHRQLLAQYFVIEEEFSQYTRRMSTPTTYGGEPELLMLAKLLHIPIAVYIRRNRKYRQIQVYGKQYQGEPLRILYSDGIHYDALLTTR
ncbi:unnamed protein product [Agarophyton chilense]|eukprot:gb/GEZJ01001835.1/.p1 GENE.gb/GEZJ01001835.1/~~gb/GEZJ01001835.1/.p1  ORF type:complete len:513 (-),score=77.84 gb/GEZJ01001835.1/:514-2052(-)